MACGVSLSQSQTGATGGFPDSDRYQDDQNAISVGRTLSYTGGGGVQTAHMPIPKVALPYAPKATQTCARPYL